MNEIELKRFQVNKRVEFAIKKGHPWIYRNQCSTALQGITVGSLLRLVGTKNQFLGIGLYQPLSAVSIRIFCLEDIPINQDYFLKKLTKAYKKRQPIIKDFSTNGFRLLHGEVDGFPGLNLDVYDQIGIVHCYLDAWLHLIAPQTWKDFSQQIGLKKLFLKYAKKSNLPPFTNNQHLLNLMTQQLEPVAEPLWFQEQQNHYPVYPISGLKTGFFLDLREVRLWLSQQNFSGKNVLNLFANNGIFSALALKKEAGRVISVEKNKHLKTQAATLFQHWGLVFEEQNWFAEDVWKFLRVVKFLPKNHKKEATYDLIIVDPPSLATQKSHQSQLKKGWIKLYQDCFSLLNPHGKLLSISCTERLKRSDQIQWTKECAKQLKRKITLEKEWNNPPDHPSHPHLPERDYFRILIWKVI